jgi:hypothetical protein
MLYSEAEATDISTNVNIDRAAAQLALSTPDAYNPFNGGCVDTPAMATARPVAGGHRRHHLRHEAGVAHDPGHGRLQDVRN